MMARVSVFLGLALCGSLLLGQEDFISEEKVDALVQPYMENRIFQSTSLGISLKGITWIRHYGKLSEANPVPAKDDTIYEIGSVTKVFTALLLADAVKNRGSFELDQTIGPYVPGLQESNPDVASKVTLKHLSQHMSGLPRMPDNILPTDPNNPFAGYDQKLLHKFLETVKLTNAPGKKNEYSNLAVGLLGDILASEFNTDYQTLVQQRIFDPLKMTESGVSLSESSSRRLAPPHNSALVEDHVWDFDALAGAGSIRSTVTDMLRFIQANLKPTETEIGKAIDLAWEKSLPAGKDQFAMGLGWMIAGDGSTRWHNGQTGGYHSIVFVNRDLEAGLVLLSNTATTELDALGQQIFQSIVGMNVKPRKFDKEVTVDEAVVKRLVGKYQLAPGVVVSVTSSADRLMAQLTGQQALRVYPESDSIWNYREVKAQLRFDIPEEGAATKVTLYQNGNVIPAPRIEP